MSYERHSIDCTCGNPECSAQTNEGWRLEWGFVGSERRPFVVIPGHDGIPVPDEDAGLLIASAPTLAAERDAARAEVERLTKERDNSRRVFAHALEFAIIKLRRERDALRERNAKLVEALRWTTERPKETGWYFWSVNKSYRQHIIIKITVFGVNPGFMGFFIPGNSLPSGLDEARKSYPDSHFAGPIAEPLLSEIDAEQREGGQ